MDNTRNLTWRLNWYRHSELEGALLLGRMARTADDPHLIASLTRHYADEAHHAWLWARAISELGLPIVQIYRGYQSFYLQHISAPTSLTEVLALTHVFEHRVDWQFRQQLRQPDLPPILVKTYRMLLADEQDHLDWVGRWLAERPEGAALLERYRRVDEKVYAELEPYLDDNIAAIPGLGREQDASITTESIKGKELAHGAR